MSEDRRTSLLSSIGYLLGVSYPVLAFSAAGRSIYQLFIKVDFSNEIGPWTSFFAACCYLAATLGFTYRRPWTWWLSLVVLGVESAGTLIIGLLSVLEPEMIGSSVWRLFGIDFAFLPLMQPFAGIAWLVWPPTRRLFGIDEEWSPPNPEPPTDPAATGA